MKALRGILLILLHLGCTLSVQLCLLRYLLLDGEPLLRCVLLSVLACVLDLVLTCLMMRGFRVSRTGHIALQFWDLLLIGPVILLAFLGFASGGDGNAFGAATVCLELLLIVQRSISFTLFDGKRKDENLR